PRSKANRAEERPRRAVDRERQRIDQDAGAAARPARRPVAIARNREQQADVTERGYDHDPAVEHQVSMCRRPPANPAAQNRLRRKLAPCAASGDLIFEVRITPQPTDWPCSPERLAAIPRPAAWRHV